MRKCIVNEKQRQAEKKRFVEDMGILLEELGLPRMAGRILGWLLICDPPHQSAGELTRALGGSKSSISSMTRLLIRIDLIQRIGLSEKRNMYYCLKPRSFSELLRARIGYLTTLREVAERGLALMASKDIRLRQRLQEMCDFYAFLEQEAPLVLERWERKSKGERAGY